MMTEREIFDAALAIADPAQRAAFLDAECGADSSLRAHVAGLLDMQAQLGSFLEGPPANAPLLIAKSTPAHGITMDEPSAESPGDIIGPYKLLEVIGEGGFGVVYLAEQSEPVRRKVALKILKPGMDSKQVVARFEAERQALAIMDHPNIARVFDGGTVPLRIADIGLQIEATSNRAPASSNSQSAISNPQLGRPYFVMEYVKGVPITQFCDEQKLTPRQRLELFVNVCQAVQHAHQKGIIHRDIKPSNVLVSRHDTTPVVKVIDFGVAKAVGQSLTDKTVFTGIAQMIGTPLYMSPEQAGMSDLDVDTRSDIYSLGVLLYELLTGTTPFSKERFKQAAYDEIRRIIREEEPPKPSTRLSSSTKSLPSISAQRHMEPAKLTKLVRGEIDWIVMKALDKDRNRRYETANGFAADVQRYLADEPVQACPPSAGYRLRKFVRRNKAQVAIAGLVLLFLALLGGGVGWSLSERSFREARVTSKVEMILEEADLLIKGQQWQNALAVVKQADAALAGSEVNLTTCDRVRQTLTDLEMVSRLEDIRLTLSEASEDAPAFDHGGTSRRYSSAFRDYGVDIEALSVEQAAAQLRLRPLIIIPLAAALDDWGHSCRLKNDELFAKNLWTLADTIDPDPWRQQVRKAIVAGDVNRLVELTVSSETSRQPIQSQMLLARSLRNANRRTQAIAFLERLSESHPSDFWVHYELAHESGLVRPIPMEVVVRHFTAARAIRPQNAATWNDLGYMMNEQGKVGEAIACYHKAIELAPKFVHYHVNLGRALKSLGKLDEAILCYRMAIQLDPKNADIHNNLGNALIGKHQFDEAIASFRSAVVLEPGNASYHGNLGNTLGAQAILGQMDEAVAHLRKAIELDPKVATYPANLALALNNHAWRLATSPDPKIRNPQRAVELIKEARQLAPSQGILWNTLGVARYRVKDWAAAIEALNKSMEFRKGGDGNDWFFLAMAYWQLGKKVEACQWYDRAVSWMEKNNPLDDELRGFRDEAKVLLGIQEDAKPKKTQAP